jgi:hypothetical protein
MQFCEVTPAPGRAACWLDGELARARGLPFETPPLFVELTNRPSFGASGLARLQQSTLASVRRRSWDSSA